MEGLGSNNSVPEFWQVDAGGEIYQGSFDELAQWIVEGAVLPQDMVRRGNLRWIEAQKVPTLIQFFNSQNSVITSTSPTAVVTANSPKPFPNVVSVPITSPVNQPQVCLVHIETQAEFVCNGCRNLFCNACPTSFGGSVKICPMCGEMCKSLSVAAEELEQTIMFEQRVTEGFGIADFLKAFWYPFNFPVSFVFGMVFYAFFSTASQSIGIGGVYLRVGALFCWMLANMLTFGILSNVVENMLQRKLGLNFMPSFDDFNIWDDALHPFFLNISVYLATFAPLLLLLGLMFAFVPDGNSRQANADAQKDALNLLRERMNGQSQQNQQSLNSLINPDDIPTPGSPDYAKKIQDLQDKIKKARKDEIETALGFNNKSEPITVSSVFRRVVSMPGIFIVAAFGSLLCGLIFLPVSLIVAAYTRNIRSVCNPTIGLDTIKRLGVDYLKILVFGLILLAFSWVTSLGLGVILAPLDLPQIGNIPAIALGSIATFYFTVVFAVILGSALYKNSEKFPLFQTI